MSLLLKDMDRFKQINDEYGHASGDRALLAVTETCHRVLRETDLFARWGGDEFAALVDAGSADADTLVH